MQPLPAALGVFYGVCVLCIAFHACFGQRALRVSRCLQPLWASGSGRSFSFSWGSHVGRAVGAVMVGAGCLCGRVGAFVGLGRGSASGLLGTLAAARLVGLALCSGGVGASFGSGWLAHAACVGCAGGACGVGACRTRSLGCGKPHPHASRHAAHRELRSLRV